MRWSRRRVAARSRPTDALVRRLNGVLDPDVRIHAVTEAADGFDARFSAVWRRYAYRVADRPEAVDPLTRGHVLAWPRALDEDAMNAAAALLVGEHDFARLLPEAGGCHHDPHVARPRLEPRRRAAGRATVRADAFCHNMVRALVGCLLAVGEGRTRPGVGRSACSRPASATRR